MTKGLRTLKVSEHDDMVVVAQWRDSMVGQYPALRWLFHIPNEGGAGWQGMMRGKKMKEAGAVKGPADWCWPKDKIIDSHLDDWDKLWVEKTSGLFIEMKLPGKKQSKEQKEFQQFVEGEGYLYKICYSGDEAIEVVKNYLGIK